MLAAGRSSPLNCTLIDRTPSRRSVIQETEVVSGACEGLTTITSLSLDRPGTTPQTDSCNPHELASGNVLLISYEVTCLWIRRIRSRCNFRHLASNSPWDVCYWWIFKLQSNIVIESSNEGYDSKKRLDRDSKGVDASVFFVRICELPT